MAETILSTPFVQDLLLPFLLVFTVIFAVLQKSEILGKGKRQVDALVSLSIALIFVSVGRAVDIVTGLVPFLAVSLVVILVFLLLLGSIYKEGEFGLHKGIKITLGILIAIGVVVAVLITTGATDYLSDLFKGESSDILANIVFILLIVGAAVVVVLGGKKASGSSS